jgi:Fur family zinc uptake transcriptional regulator
MSPWTRTGRAPSGSPGGRLEDAVLHVLAATPKPLGAYDIVPAVARPGAGRVHPSQVYRALARLIGARVVVRVDSLSAYLPRREEAPLILICTGCGAAMQVDGATMHRALCETAKRKRFVVGRSIVEALGRCATCAAAG